MARTDGDGQPIDHIDAVGPPCRPACVGGVFALSSSQAFEGPTVRVKGSARSRQRVPSPDFLPGIRGHRASTEGNVRCRPAPAWSTLWTARPGPLARCRSPYAPGQRSDRRLIAMDMKVCLGHSAKGLQVAVLERRGKHPSS